MVDVVFLLIVFFLTTSTLVEMTRAEVDLPREQGDEEVQADSPGLIVNITADGVLVVEGEEIDMPRLLEMVRGEIEKADAIERVDLLVRADRAAPLAHLNRVARGLVAEGVRDWRLATRPAPRGGGE